MYMCRCPHHIYVSINMTYIYMYVCIHRVYICMQVYYVCFAIHGYIIRRVVAEGPDHDFQSVGTADVAGDRCDVVLTALQTMSKQMV